MEEIMTQDHDVITYTDYETYKHDLDMELQGAVERFVRIGYLLKVAQDTGILASSGYPNVNEFAMKEYGLDKTQVSRFIRINDRFSKDGYSMELKEEYQKFGYAKLALMLTLPDELNEILTPEMSKSEIIAVKEEYEEEQKISDIEVMIEQEPETTRTAETTFEKALLNIFHEDPQLFADVITTLKREGDILEVLAPADTKVYMTRIPVIGKLAMSVNSPQRKIELVNTRSMEKEQIMMEEITRTVQGMAGTQEDAREAWEEIYHEKFPKAEKEKVAPVQRKESHVQVTKKKTEPEQETPKTLHDIEPEIPEPSPAAPEEEPEEIKPDEEKETEEQQLPGQDSIENHPEYMPDVKTEEMAAQNEQKADGPDRNTIRGYKAAVSQNINRLNTMWLGEEKDKWERMLNLIKEMQWRLEKIIEAEGKEK